MESRKTYAQFNQFNTTLHQLYKIQSQTQNKHMKTTGEDVVLTPEPPNIPKDKKKGSVELELQMWLDLIEKSIKVDWADGQTEYTE
jgi:hypothetical protein